MVYDKILEYLKQSIPGCRIAFDGNVLQHPSDRGRYLLWRYLGRIFVRGAYIPGKEGSSKTAGTIYEMNIGDPEILQKMKDYIESYIEYRELKSLSSDD